MELITTAKLAIASPTITVVATSTCKLLVAGLYTYWPAITYHRLL
jgi:hypothetical protein